MNRTDVYLSLDSERDYQEQRWAGHRHSIEEYLLYIEHYTQLCRTECTTADFSVPFGDTTARELMRKITALGVACGEEHGFPVRELR